MAPSQSHSYAYKAGHIFCVLFSILSATTLLTLTTGQGPETQALCSAEMCMTATIYSNDPNTLEFSLWSKAQVGWLGIGFGGKATDMDGNDLAMCWPTTTGQGAILSQRFATSNDDPTEIPTAVEFQVLGAKSGVMASNSSFTCTFTRPLVTAKGTILPDAKELHVIYAVGKNIPTGEDPQTAKIQEHSSTGHGILAIQRKEGGGGNGNVTTTSGSGSPAQPTKTTAPDGDGSSKPSFAQAGYGGGFSRVFTAVAITAGFCLRWLL
ncbi:hypothetical protein BX616_001900 [Lobosporangium transversale]|uniref:DOMON domain-containing protein n=1 Tax=Lobosporangium transversale TaxID=64571 RepID=A0A1Y2GC34_9FUNG|nr:hypothetical protein BCR41DRAFT_389083 [Lobosporangium transversale]KAF9902578.1 hypothetical protein BX616_001900 [Lobosporangium transversale]ORZ06734.1 hypothetical protein BCR41DRAFT_389083 [Lobosporangium transversale]|eukprot:XP_021877655.1 hypothetical protein BCR41DRAFT_389083 [Lobosporangium transversale]